MYISNTAAADLSRLIGDEGAAEEVSKKFHTLSTAEGASTMLCAVGWPVLGLSY